MAKLNGTTIVAHPDTGAPAVLYDGDDLPGWAEGLVGEHLLGSDGPPAKSALKPEWEAYARSQGASDADLDGKSKDDLINAYGD